MEKQSIRHYWKLASALGLFALIAAGCKLDRSGIAGPPRDWETSATPPQICPGDPVRLAWDTGVETLPSGSNVRVTSDPDASGLPVDRTQPQSEVSIRITEDTTFLYTVIGGGFIDKENSVDVLESPLYREVTFDGVCNGGVPGHKWADLQRGFGECVEVMQICNFGNPGSVRVSVAEGPNALIGMGECTDELNGKPGDYSVAFEPDISPPSTCGSTTTSGRPRDITLTFVLGCGGTLPGCGIPSGGAGGGMEPEPESVSDVPEAGACFDTCDPADANSCLAGLACLPRSVGSSEYICYNEGICSASTPGATEQPSGDQPCTCGDGVCEQTRCNELQQTCPADCGQSQPQQPPAQPAAVCGDNVCNGSETCSTCSQDCGPC